QPTQAVHLRLSLARAARHPAVAAAARAVAHPVAAARLALLPALRAVALARAALLLAVPARRARHLARRPARAAPDQAVPPAAVAAPVAADELRLRIPRRRRAVHRRDAPCQGENQDRREPSHGTLAGSWRRTSPSSSTIPRSSWA